MDFINDSDYNSDATFVSDDGTEHSFPVHVRGNVATVEISFVPDAQGSELMLLARGEAGYTGAAVRIRDVLQMVVLHHPELLAEVQVAMQAQGTGDDSSDDDSRERRYYDGN